MKILKIGNIILGSCSQYSSQNNGQFGNLVYQMAKWDKSNGKYICTEGSSENTILVSSERYCILNTTSTYVPYQSFCISDKAIAGIRLSLKNGRPSSWPQYIYCDIDGTNYTTGGYGCPSCNSMDTLCCSNHPYTCPANYHCLANGDEDKWCKPYFNTSSYRKPGETPYVDWPKMMYDTGLEWGSYLFVYDDNIMGLSCNTMSDNGSTGYSITFCQQML